MERNVSSSFIVDLLKETFSKYPLGSIKAENKNCCKQAFKSSHTTAARPLLMLKMNCYV